MIIMMEPIGIDLRMCIVNNKKVPHAVPGILPPVDSAVGGTKHCGYLGKSDGVLHLKAASIICGCEACKVIIFLLDLSSWSRTHQANTARTLRMTWPNLLQVDSATKHNDLANKDESMFRLKGLRHRDLLITLRSTILCRSRLRLLSFFHLPVCLNSWRV
jgi:hypothetical protein